MKRAIKKLRQDLIDGMVEFMEGEDDCAYEQADIDRCTKIVDAFLASMEQVPSKDKNSFILKSVKATILKLNKLNANCDGGLIETEQREQLWELITAAATDAGLVTEEHDITERWRTW